jgi:hypothetical protein
MSHKSHNWASALKAIFSPVRKRRQSGNTALRVESLDERIVPTKTYNPAPVGDGAANSLRTDLTDANGFNDADIVINLTTGTYNLTIGNGLAQDNANASGDLDIDNTNAGIALKKYTIVGAGAGTVIDASGIAGLDRVFQILGTDVEVTFRNLTIQGGTALDNGTAGAAPGSTDALGGGVLNTDGANVTFDGVILTNNKAGAAGVAPAGLDGKAGSQKATAGANGTDGGAGKNALGGGVYSAGGTVTITGTSDFKANKVVAGDGGAGGNGKTGAAGAGAVAGKVGGNGGAGGQGGDALGAGVYAAAGSIVVNSSSLVEQNVAEAGKGGDGGNGAAGGAAGTKAAGAGGQGGAGGNAGNGGGGGIYVVNGSVALSGGAQVSANLVNDQVLDGAGGAGGLGGVGGAIGGGTLAGAGGAGKGGGLGGNTLGGGIAILTGNVTIDGAAKVSGNALNAATAAGIGGNGGNGGNAGGVNLVGGAAGAGNNGGTAFGGGVYAGSGSVTLTAGASVKANLINQGVAAGNGGLGGAGGIGKTPGVNGAGGNGGDAGGAGIYATAGSVSVTASSVLQNVGRAGFGGGGANGVAATTANGLGKAGGNAGNGGSFLGGGIYTGTGGTVTLATGSTVNNNTGVGGGGGLGGLGGNGGANKGIGGRGGNGGNAGTSVGGGVYAKDGSVTISGASEVKANVAVAGNAGSGNNGGTGGKTGPTAGGGAGGDGGAAAKASGGGIFALAGKVDVSGGSTVAQNVATGGGGGSGGIGGDSKFRAGNGGNATAGAAAAGAGIAAAAGDVSVTGASTVNLNVATGGIGGIGGNGGAAAATAGTLNVAGNGGTGGAGGVAHGGGIWMANGTLTVDTSSQLTQNVAAGGNAGIGGVGGAGAAGKAADGAGGNGGDGGGAEGAGAWVQAGAVSVAGSSAVNQNVGAGGNGGNGGNRGGAGFKAAANGNGGNGGLADGGGIWAGAAGVTVTGRVTFNSNAVTGGNGGVGGGVAGGKAGTGGAGGNASGGAVFTDSGALGFSLSTATFNRAQGGNGGNGGAAGTVLAGAGAGGVGGNGQGGGLATATGAITLDQANIGGNGTTTAGPGVIIVNAATGNAATGGNGGNGAPGAGGGNGGNSLGGGVYAGTTAASLAITNSSFNNNQAGPGGAGGVGAPNGTQGNSIGGAIYAAAPTVTIVNTTVSENKVNAGTKSQGGGVYTNSAAASIHNSTIVLNTGVAATQGFGIRNEGTLELVSDLIGQNGVGVAGAGAGRDLSSVGTLTGSNNLIEDNTGFTGITNGANGNIIGQAFTNPAFNAVNALGKTITNSLTDNTPGNTVFVYNSQIASNGTSYHRLVTPAEFPGSPLFPNSALPPGALTALDLGSNPDGLTVDQIQAARVQGTAADIGSIEGSGGTTNTSGANVLSADFTPGGGSFSSVVLTFDEPIDPTTFTLNGANTPTGDIVSLTGPDGAITPTAISFDATKTIATVTFPSQSTLGDYSITLGVNILDAALNQMNQNKNAINGEVPEDQFTGSETLAAANPLTVTGSFTGPDLTTFNTLHLVFGAPVDTATFDASDIVLTAPDGTAIPVTAINPVDAQTFDVTFADQTATGTYTAVIGPDISDTSGNAMAQAVTQTSFLGDQTPGQPPSVQTATFTGATANTFDTVTITFDENIDASSVAAGDITLTGPDGNPITITNVSPASGSTNQLVVTFAPQTAAGRYSLSVGPDILDLEGLAMTAAFTTGANIAQTPIFAVGASDGSVRIVNADTGAVIISNFRPFDSGTTQYTGIVSVALADLNGDGFADLWVAPASPQGQDGLPLTTTPTQVMVFDGAQLANGTSPTTTIANFTPFTTSNSVETSTGALPADTAYTNGLNIDAGDVDGDGTPDLIAGTRGGVTGFGLNEFGRLAVVSGTDKTTHIGADAFPFSQLYQKGVVVAAVDLDGNATPGVQIAVTRGGPVAASNPNKDIKLKAYALQGGALTDLNLNVNGSPTPTEPAFAPFPGIERDGRVTGVDSNGDGKDELVFSALDRTDPNNTTVRVIVYGVDTTNGNLTTLSTGTGGTPGSYTVGTNVVDHAISRIETGPGSATDNLAIALEDADPNIQIVNPLTGADAGTGGFSLPILTGGVTLDGI